MAKEMQAPILIIGGGPAGMAAAVELADLGQESLIVEKEPQLGGLAVGMACKATDKCARCGVCLADDLIADTVGADLIETRTETVLAGLSSGDAGFEAVLKDSSGREEKRIVAGVVAALGAAPIDPALKSQFGYGIIDNVVSGLELERMVRQDQAVRRPSDGKRPGRVGFVQCVGSRDISVGGGKGGFTGCSRICCGYTARLADWIAAYQPGTELTVFYMDLQSVGRDPAGLLARLKEKVEFVRAVPGHVNRGADGAVKLQFKPEFEPGLEEREVDLLVLSTGLTGPRTGAVLREGLGLEVDGDGFFTAPGPGRVLVAGAAGGPLGIAESVRQGRAAGRRAAEWRGGSR